MAIKCPKCHSDNTDTARFCNNCATSLSAPRDHGPSLTKTLKSPTYVVTSGTVIAGHYEVQENLGKGGMGEVHRALDKNLGREVAIKILPEEFSKDPERLARFEREAKLLATLNHPNIAAIYGFEEAEGRRFLVMELVAGETLQTRLDKSALPIDEALETCLQVAEGLEAAHGKGIIHRDLKPGNIMLTPEGKVKILDFGLAKAYAAETTDIDIANSPTITAQMTEPGIILGTAAYMSPEQARSRPVDRRTDIWSFGCVLYECLTGTLAFHGETVSDTLAQILKVDPDWAKLPQEAPIRIRTLLRRCLEKNPKERLRDIGDARLDIEEALGQPLASEAAVIRRPGRAWIIGSVLCVLAVGALATFITWHMRPAPSPAVGRLTLKLNTRLWLDGLRRDEFQRPTRTAFALSGDGRFIIYSAIGENPGPQVKPQIYLRRMDQMEAAPVAGTEGGINPSLSPDDRWIGFWTEADRKLYKVPISGGVPVPLCDGGSDADWGPNNMIVFSAGEGLSAISSEGGKPKILTVPNKDKDEYRHHLPHWLPDGGGLLFTIASGMYDVSPSLAVLDLKSRKWRILMEDAADGRYIRTGHLVFLRRGTLMAVPFDLGRREVAGEPIPIVANVMQALNSFNANNNLGAGQYSVSNSGWLAYAPGGDFPDLDNSLVRVSQKGVLQTAIESKAPFSCPRFSPDGRHIAYQTYGVKRQLFLYDLNRATATPLTADGIVHFLTWTPDGKRVVFGWSKKSGFANLYWQPVDGSSPMERLTTSEHMQNPGSFTPDGAILAFADLSPETSEDILLLDMKSRRVTPFLNSKAYDGFPEFSPDGRWLTYASNESGRFEVWVQPFPGPGGKWQISREGGWQPIWSKDGKQLFYRRAEQIMGATIFRSSAEQVWVVDINVRAGFSAGKPRLLFEQRGFVFTAPTRGWDLWPDGQGFLMVKTDESKRNPVTEIVLVQNWFEELKRLVPPGK